MRKVACMLLMLVCVFLTSCGASDPFQCDYCGSFVEDGKKYETVDSYGDKWNACEDCYEEIKEIKNALNQ